MPYFISILTLFLLVACESSPEEAQYSQLTVANTTLVSENTRELKTDSLPSEILEESEKYTQQEEISFTKNPPFTIKLRPTPKVKNLIASEKETLIVSVVLFGVPSQPSALKEEQYFNPEEELIYLLDKEYVLSPNQQELTIEEAIPTEALNALKSPNYTVVVDAYSGRKSSKDNLFHTKIVTGTINELKGTLQILPISLL